ncbi:MAG: hypothetical protein MRY78_18935 [Saprospiraceae bacterium]|nr:hypothetical protein [Saprospiraceae bacterium]
MFQGKQKVLHFTQVNNGKRPEIFPLLCPVREKDWLDGWEYEMIYSKSGLAEENAVFTTPNEDGQPTVWQIIAYDSENYKIGFLRIRAGYEVVRIHIELTERADELTDCHISYRYTGLSEERNAFIENELESEFRESMKWWEKALNYYLETNTCLKK